MFQKKAKEQSSNDGRAASPLVGNAAARDALQKAAECSRRPKVSSFATKRERLHYVADMIESAALKKDGIGFDMEFWRCDLAVEQQNSCNTLGCIAGWTMFLENGTDYGKADPFRTKFASPAATILKLSPDEQTMLFHGNNAYGVRVIRLDDITEKQAAAVIRDFADNGEVRWGKFDRNGKAKV